MSDQILTRPDQVPSDVDFLADGNRVVFERQKDE